MFINIVTHFLLSSFNIKFDLFNKVTNGQNYFIIFLLFIE